MKKESAYENEKYGKKKKEKRKKRETLGLWNKMKGV
jgi:hypothetical protein